MEKLATLRAKRGEIVDKMAGLANSETALTEEQKKQFDDFERELGDVDEQIGRIERAHKAAVVTARPVEGQDVKVPAQPKSDRYEKDKTLVVGGALKMLLLGGNNPINALAAAKEVYGERHPVTDFCGAAFKALRISLWFVPFRSAASGGGGTCRITSPRITSPKNSTLTGKFLSRSLHATLRRTEGHSRVQGSEEHADERVRKLIHLYRKPSRHHGIKSP